MSKYLVAIDAGHGMTTGGKRSVNYLPICMLMES